MKKRCGVVKTYKEWCQPKIVSNTLELLDKEIPKYKSKIDYVHLCFSTDPFMYEQDEICDLSLKVYEPNTASFKDRISSLKYLHRKGFETWVSMEPYPTPNFIEQDLIEILELISFIDKIVFGRLNYNAKSSEFKYIKEFYNDISLKVIKFCTNKENKLPY